MSSIVRLGPGKSGGPLGIPAELVDEIILTPDMRSARLKAGKIIKIGGANDGEVIVDGEVAANMRCIIHTPGELAPRKYNTVVGYNPLLLQFGTVSCAGMVGPGQGDKIIIGFHAGKKVNLNELEYVFELFMID